MAHTLRIHKNGVPAHVQIFVHPGGVVGQWIDNDEDGNEVIVSEAVYDVGSLGDIVAKFEGEIEVEVIDHEETPSVPHTEASAANFGAGASEEE